MTISMKLFISFFVFTTISFNSLSFSASASLISYADHCASVVPESTENINAGSQFVHLIHTGYYYTGGGSDILNLYSPDDQVKNSVGFQCWDISETHVQGLFKVEATLEFQVTNMIELQSMPPKIIPGSVSFRLNGFWSKSSGKLCMVGSSSIYSKQGNPLVVLKLYNLIMNNTSVTSLISGTFENVMMISENDPKSLGPISILMFPRMNYAYTLVSNSTNSSCSSGSEDTPRSLHVERFCSLLSSIVLNHDFPLKFSSHCITPENCIPISLSNLPRAVLFKDIACSEDNRRVRVLVEFSDGRLNQCPTLFNPNTTLVGEGSWDAKKNQLCVVACRFLNTTNSLNNTNVGDCSTRLSLRIPATGTIGSTSSIVGHIWSTKTVTELGYFEKITFASRDCGCRKGLLPGQTYEYTKMEKVTNLCSRKKTANDMASIYPNPFSHVTSFIMHAENSEGQVGFGNCVPLSVDNSIYRTDWSSGEDACAPESNQEYSVAPLTYSYNHSNPINISYKIDLQLQSNPKWGKQSVKYEMHINAEGIYDGTEGSLCMVGCRTLVSNSQQATNDSIDCEILVHFQFPATTAKDLHHIKGSIESTRKKSDPLHFERLDLSTAAKHVEEKRSIWRMDGKITLVLISTTLACVFAALQIFHVKRNPEVIPSISILMLLILTLSYMLPLGINFEAMFMHNFNRQNVHLGGGGWLEFNEIIIRVATLVAFLIQFHLLKLTWSAKLGNGTRKDLRVMEKRALFVALHVYAVGALAALFLHRQKLRKRDDRIELPHLENTVLDALTSYGCLVLDSFLFPQILLNIFCQSKENALSVWFYIGTTVARVLPHAHALYRAHSPANDQFDDFSYNYPAPVADLFSIAWNAIIPLEGVLFAGIIYLQQRFGGRCIAPGKLREVGIYKKVPTVHEE
ncbi:hypothetical protein RchiOBHm_Chr5g0034231 [Rosa chinensis]|uniref:RING-type E3 ubiquitin transferase n=1 Tax=Rosa chinensis TaxID=74649 RepID=A0A2P6QAX2_ROSCH|nr:uncharacterized protein LOC112167462 [Rosa chinensis]PRQ31326.1 hypothetical protein RchiOBHm_Chr5g0034231 [Rosa chinensis]